MLGNYSNGNWFNRFWTVTIDINQKWGHVPSSLRNLNAMSLKKCMRNDEARQSFICIRTLIKKYFSCKEYGSIIRCHVSFLIPKVYNQFCIWPKNIHNNSFLVVLQNALFKVPNANISFQNMVTRSVQIVEKIVVVLSTNNKSCQNNAKPHFSVERTHNNFFCCISGPNYDHQKSIKTYQETSKCFIIG